MTLGNRILRNQERDQMKRLGFEPYSPLDDKEINDKNNQTEESNNGLAEKIFAKDTKGMLDSDILIFDVANTSVGTTAEIGQWAMVHELNQRTNDSFLLKRLNNKPIFFHSSDLRDTEIPEAGYRRSHSYNQYLLGCVYKCNPKGIQNWEEILEELRDNY